MNYTNFSFYLVSYKDKNICYLRTTTTSYRVVEQNPSRIQRTDDLIVKSVLENVLNKCVQTVESSSKPSGRRGKDRREKHSFIKSQMSSMILKQGWTKMLSLSIIRSIDRWYVVLM